MIRLTQLAVSKRSVVVLITLALLLGGLFSWASLKQELLESLSEEQRLETLLTVMTSLLPRLELRKEREEAIRGNGKGH